MVGVQSLTELKVWSFSEQAQPLSVGRNTTRSAGEATQAARLGLAWPSQGRLCLLTFFHICVVFTGTVQMQRDTNLFKPSSAPLQRSAPKRSTNVCIVRHIQATVGCRKGSKSCLQKSNNLSTTVSKQAAYSERTGR